MKTAKPSPPWWLTALPKTKKPKKCRTPNPQPDIRHQASKQRSLALVGGRKALAQMRAGIASCIYEAAMDGLKQMAEPPLGVKRKWGREQEEWLEDWLPRAEKTALRIGSLAAKSAIDNLIGSGFVTALAQQARAHAGSKGGSAPRKRKGGKPAVWKERVKKEILSKRGHANERDNIRVINRAVQLEILRKEEVSTGEAKYFDCATNAQIAASKKDLSATISKLRKASRSRP